MEIYIYIYSCIYRPSGIEGGVLEVHGQLPSRTRGIRHREPGTVASYLGSVGFLGSGDPPESPIPVILGI